MDDIRKNLAMAALDEIPVLQETAQEIIGVLKSGGQITGYKLADESIIMKDQAVDMARKGLIAGVGIAHNKDTEYLKSIPDGTEANNLSNLPVIEE